MLLRIFSFLVLQWARVVKKNEKQGASTSFEVYRRAQQPWQQEI